MPDPYSFISVAVPPIFIAVMHRTLNRAEQADYPGVSAPKFTTAEWIITILGGLVLLLAIAGFTQGTDMDGMIFTLAMCVLIAGSLVFFWRLPLVEKTEDPYHSYSRNH